MKKRRRVGVRRFKAEATKILSEVREDEAEYVVTRRGQPIALITPIGSDEVEGESGDEISRSMARLRRTAKMVSAVEGGASAFEYLPALTMEQAGRTEEATSGELAINQQGHTERQHRCYRNRAEDEHKRILERCQEIFIREKLTVVVETYPGRIFQQLIVGES